MFFPMKKIAFFQITVLDIVLGMGVADILQQILSIHPGEQGVITLTQTCIICK